MIAFNQRLSIIKEYSMHITRQEVYMRFILAPNTIVKLDFLRDKYQEIKKIDLNNSPSFFGMPTVLGGVDIAVRKSQIEFLEKVRVILKPNTFEEEKIETLDELAASTTASRVMFAAVLYIKEQIEQTYTWRTPEEKSVLYTLLDKDLGITNQNYLDEEDKEMCFLAAKRLITSSISALDQANSILKKAKLTEFTEKEWNNFQTYLCTRTINKIKKDPYANYPITNITQKLFGAAGSYAGATIGYISGDVLSHSTNALPHKTKFTALIGSTLLVCNYAGPAGVALFAPAIAERVISAFCSISLAHILSFSMGLVGQGMGTIVGIPLDLAYKLIWSACVAIGSYGYSSQKPLLTGIRLGDGVTVFCGVPFVPTPENELPTEYKQVEMDVREGQLYLDGKVVNIAETEMKLPESIMMQLEAKLQEEIQQRAPLELTNEEIESENTEAIDKIATIFS